MRRIKDILMIMLLIGLVVFVYSIIIDPTFTIIISRMT